MERNGIGYISPKYSAQDFLNLNLSLRSPDTVWKQGIDIFKDRIESRYFTPIDIMLIDHDKLEQNGFAIMALNCLLVDSFFQFREPDNIINRGRRRENQRRTNVDCYTSFLTQNFPNDFNGDSALYFYKDIRCGILHSAQTKNGSQLTYDKTYVVEIFNYDMLRVDIVNFSAKMREYYNWYITRLESGDVAIRSSFVKQMKKICRA